MTSLGSLTLCTQFGAAFHYNLVGTSAGNSPSIAPEGVLIETGKWYFEVEMLESRGGGVLWVSLSGNISSHPTTFNSVLQVGWGDASYKGNVGQCSHSWGITGTGVEPIARHSNKSWSFGRRWLVGDVIGCLLDLEKMSIKYLLNGEDLGVAFDTSQLAARCVGFTPTVSLEYGCKVYFSLGDYNFRSRLPLAAQPVSLWVRQRVSDIFREQVPAETFGQLRATYGAAGIFAEQLLEEPPVIAPRPKLDYYSEPWGPRYKATVLVDGLLLTSGKWYYEVILPYGIETDDYSYDSAVQAGWADVTFLATLYENQIGACCLLPADCCPVPNSYCLSPLTDYLMSVAVCCTAHWWLQARVARLIHGHTAPPLQTLTTKQQSKTGTQAV